MSPRSFLAVIGILTLAARVCPAQDVIGDILAGKLVKPKVGQWAWYDVVSSDGSSRHMLRQAIVGEEKVGSKKGYWLEFEIAPAAGYKSYYKLLLTGPASDPKNIHRILTKDGPEPVEETPIDKKPLAGSGAEKAKRDSKGMDTVSTPEGEIKAEKFEVTQGERKYEIWMDEDLPPMGVVRIKTPEGEMILRGHGSGGEYGESAISKEEPKGNLGVTTSVDDAKDKPRKDADSPKTKGDKK